MTRFPTLRVCDNQNRMLNQWSLLFFMSKTPWAQHLLSRSELDLKALDNVTSSVLYTHVRRRRNMQCSIQQLVMLNLFFGVCMKKRRYLYHIIAIPYMVVSIHGLDSANENRCGFELIIPLSLNPETLIATFALLG
jgi:hypothetical protein